MIKDGSLKLAKVVIERLDVGEDTHGVRFSAHHHHVLYFNESVTTSLLPARESFIQKELMHNGRTVHILCGVVYKYKHYKYN